MRGTSFVSIVVIVLCAATVQAGTRADPSGHVVVDFASTMDMPFKAVQNPGNSPDTTGFGAVDYSYRISQFEVTTGQYTEFLNAVAADDTHDLYSVEMWDHWGGCKIERLGSAGSYTYEVAPDWEDRPVTFIGWGDAARFANWLTNGMPSGSQSLATTEDGSYLLNGATSDSELLAVSRGSNARYVIPSEDEWYKAACHKNDGVTGNYFDYPTGSDAFPSNSIEDPDPGNNANFHEGSVRIGGDYAIGEPYYRTEVGEFENSSSPYGASDMGGNVWEWNEAIVSQSYRGLRGGSFDGSPTDMQLRLLAIPEQGYTNVGLRIAEVPEPATMGLLVLGGLAMLRRRR